MVQANPRMLLVGVDAEIEGRLVAAIKGFDVARAAADLRAVSEAAALHRPSAAVVAVPDSTETERSLLLVTQLAQGGMRVMVVGPNKNAELILRSMRAGAQEFVVPGEELRLAEVLEGALSQDAAQGAGAVVAMFPAKGGSGATVTAVNLADALGRSRDRVCLLDLDPYFGDAVSLLDLPRSYCIGEVLANLSRLDRELLDSSVVRHASGFAVLGQSDQPEHNDPVKAAQVGPLIGFLRQHYRYLIIDGLGGFDELSLAALDASDRILLLVAQDVTAVRRAQRSVELFRRLGYPDSKISVVVNRFQRSSSLTVPLLSETLGIAVAATVGNDFGAMVDSINKGLLLSQSAPRSVVTRDLAELAGLVRGDEAPPAPARSFFSRLLRR